MENLNKIYQLVLEGTYNKEYFLKNARYKHPEYITPHTTFNDAVTILKGKSIITESANYSNVNVQLNYFDTFKQKLNEAKVEEKETSKEVTDLKNKARVFEDQNTLEVLYSQQFLTGFYSEMKKDKNMNKTVNQIKEIVLKNLIKNKSYYTENDKYGVEGLKATKAKEPEEVPSKTRHQGMIEVPKRK